MGMKATIQLQAVKKNGRTVLQHRFCSAPFKVMDVTEDKKKETLHLMIMSASPGVLDGDRIAIDIDIKAGATLALHTQSYQRLFQMKDGAVQSMTVEMQEGATFCFLPHPLVPHQGSAFQTHHKIFLEPACTISWGEVLTCGRNLHDEKFRYTKMQSITEIFLHRKLVVRENLWIEPAVLPVGGIGGLEGFTHQASYFFIREDMDHQALLSVIEGELQAEQNIEYGYTALPIPGFLLRILGYKAEQLHQCLKTVQSTITHFLNEKNKVWTVS